MHGTASVYGFDYDPSTLGYTVSGLDFVMMSDNFSSFSDLDLREVVQAVGTNVRVTDNLIWNVSFRYHDYQDDQPYLYDTTGRRLSYSTGFSWIF